MSNKLITQAISSVLALGIVSVSTDVVSAPATVEKCYGISKAGQNDCSGQGISCAGEAKINGSGQAWINVPTGLCQRIVNGSTKPTS